MSASWAETSAPCGLPLCGGWAVALDRRASVRVERVPGSPLEVEWPERLLRVQGPDGRGAGLAFALDLLERRGAREGFRVTLRSRVPEESGLAPGLALRAALGLALDGLGFPGPAPSVPGGAREAAIRLGGLSDSKARLACDPARVEEALALVESGLPVPAIAAEPAPLELAARLLRSEWAGLGAALAACWPAVPPPLQRLAASAAHLGAGPG